jgi:hypothetical protein
LSRLQVKTIAGKKKISGIQTIVTLAYLHQTGTRNFLYVIKKIVTVETVACVEKELLQSSNE